MGMNGKEANESKVINGTIGYSDEKVGKPRKFVGSWTKRKTFGEAMNLPAFHGINICFMDPAELLPVVMEKTGNPSKK
jgi:hypothetical protein